MLLLLELLLELLLLFLFTPGVAWAQGAQAATPGMKKTEAAAPAAAPAAAASVSE